MIRAALLGLATTPGLAAAGPSDFGAVTPTEVVAGRTIELEARIADDNDLGSLHRRATAWIFAPAFGASECVELQLPVEMTWRSEVGTPSAFTLSRYGLDLRYRFAQNLPAVLRFALSRDVVVRNLAHVELDVAASYDVGAVRLAADAGLTFEANRGGVHSDLRPSAGASARISDEVRLGAEAFGVYSLDAAVESWAAAGPSIAWRHGRVWIAAAFGLGITGISSVGRFAWGVGF